MLEVALGRCYRVRSSSQEERTSWAAHGYDSAWAAEGVIGIREENCVRDPARIRITNVVLGNTRAAQDSGYEVCNGRLRNVVGGEAVKEAQRDALAASRRLPVVPVTATSAARGPGSAPRRALETAQDHIEMPFWRWRRSRDGNTATASPFTKEGRGATT